jgi:hypothetical protein
MKKIFIFVFFISFFATSVIADWTIASRHINGTTEFYIDKNNIRKDGSTRYFWILMNLTGKKIDREHNSALVYVQLDCKALRAKDLEFIAKSSQMGKGEEVGKFSPPDEWKYPPPDSNEEKTYKIVCDL